MDVPEPSVDQVVAARLRTAPFEVVARFADASNATLLVRLTDRDPRTLDDLAGELDREVELDDLDPGDLAVHKPRRGESPLWDFPDGTLHRREIAAYEVSAALGWDLVPVTVLVEDGPFGPGSLQRFVPHDPAAHYFHLLEHGGDDVARQLRAMVIFDQVIDNADRKGGHVLLERSVDTGDRLHGRVRLVDHGVSLHVERKLRTVGWDFAGDPVPAELRADVAALCDALDRGPVAGRLSRLLAPAELDALRTRARWVADQATYPQPLGHHPFPWPLL